MMGDNRDNSTDSRVLRRSAMCRSRTSSAARRSSSSPLLKASAPGRSGAGRGRCAGAGCSRSCDEAQGRRQTPARRLEIGARSTKAPSQPRPTAEKAAAPAQQAPRASARAATSALEQTIGYRFEDRDLLDRALTHISALTGGSRAGSYQRLEFLGDHVLGLVISDMLFRAFPKAR